MTATTRVRALTLVAATAWAATLLTGCSGGSTPTCKEFAGMDPHTGLLGTPSGDQTSAIKSVLKDHDYDTSSLNVSIAYTSIVAYCNIYEGTAGNNQSSSIAGAIG